MATPVTLGALTLIGEVMGTHVHVTVLGAGEVGQRPLCGNIVVSQAEWGSLVDLEYVETIARRVGQRWRDEDGVDGSTLDLLGQATRTKES